MFSAERRPWSAYEDQLLRDAVNREDPGNPTPSKWHAISKHVPSRTNKGCRKRWFANMPSDLVKGAWLAEEDEALVKAIEKYGTRWSMVASLVEGRNSDPSECAKRWTDTLNPAIDRSSWTPQQDSTLVDAVSEHGKVWTKIVKTYFPGRTGLSARNRYNSLTQSNRTSYGSGRRFSNAPRGGLPSCSSTITPVAPSHFSPGALSSLCNRPRCSNFSIDTSCSPTFSSSRTNPSYTRVAGVMEMGSGGTSGPRVPYPTVVHDMPPVAQWQSFDTDSESANSRPLYHTPMTYQTRLPALHMSTLATGGNRGLGDRSRAGSGSLLVHGNNGGNSSGLFFPPSLPGYYSTPGARSSWELDEPIAALQLGEGVQAEIGNAGCLSA